MALQTNMGRSGDTGMPTIAPPSQSSPQQRRPRANKVKQQFTIDTALPSAISTENRMRQVMIGSNQSIPVIAKSSETRLNRTGKSAKDRGRMQLLTGLKSYLPSTSLTPSPVPAPELKSWEVVVPNKGCVVVGDTLIKPIKDRNSSEAPIKVKGKASKDLKVAVIMPERRMVSDSPRSVLRSPQEAFVGDTSIKPIKDRNSSEGPIKVKGKASKDKKVAVIMPERRMVSVSPPRVSDSPRSVLRTPQETMESHRVYSELPCRHSNRRRSFPSSLRRYSVSPQKRSSTSPRRRRISYEKPFKRTPVFKDNVYVTHRSSAVPYQGPESSSPRSPQRVSGYAGLYGKGTIEGLKPGFIACTAPKQRPVYLRHIQAFGYHPASSPERHQSPEDSEASPKRSLLSPPQKPKVKPRQSLLPPKPEKQPPEQPKLPAEQIRIASEERLKQLDLEDASRSSKASIPESSPRRASGKHHTKKTLQDSLILALAPRKSSKRLQRKSVARPYVPVQTIVRNLRPEEDSRESVRSESMPQKFSGAWPPSMPSAEESLPARYSEPPSRVFGQRIPTKAVPVRTDTARVQGDTEKVCNIIPKQDSSQQDSTQRDTAQKQYYDTELAEQETVITSTDIVKVPGCAVEETPSPQPGAPPPSPFIPTPVTSTLAKDKDDSADQSMLSPTSSRAPGATITTQTLIAPDAAVSPTKKVASPKPLTRRSSTPMPETFSSSARQLLDIPTGPQDTGPMDVLQGKQLFASYPPEVDSSDLQQEMSAPAKCSSAPVVVGDPEREDKLKEEKRKLAPVLKRSSSLPNPSKLGLQKSSRKLFKKRVSFHLPNFGRQGDIPKAKVKPKEEAKSMPSVYSQETPWHFGAPVPSVLSRSDGESENSLKSFETLNPHYMRSISSELTQLPHVQLMQSTDLHPAYYTPEHLRELLKKYCVHAPELVIDLVPEPEVIVPDIDQCLHNPGGTVAWYNRKPVEKHVEIKELNLSPEPNIHSLSRPWLRPTNMKLARNRRFPLLTTNREHGTPHALGHFCTCTLEKFWGMYSTEKIQQINDYLDTGSSIKNLAKPKMVVESLDVVEPSNKIISCDMIGMHRSWEDAVRSRESIIKRSAVSAPHVTSTTVVKDGVNLKDYFFSTRKSSFEVTNIPVQEAHDEHDPALTVLSETLPSTSDIFPKYCSGKLRSKHSFVHAEPIPEEVEPRVQVSQEFSVTMQNLPKEVELKPKCDTDGTNTLRGTLSGGFGPKEETPETPKELKPKSDMDGTYLVRGTSSGGFIPEKETPKPPQELEPESEADDDKTESPEERWPYPYILHTSGSGGFFSEALMPTPQSKQSTTSSSPPQSLTVAKSLDVKQASPDSDTKQGSVLSINSPPKTPASQPKTPCPSPMLKTPVISNSVSFAQEKDVALRGKHSRTMHMPFGEPRLVRKGRARFYLTKPGVTKVRVPLSIAHLVSKSARFSIQHGHKPSGMVPRCGLCGISVED